MDIAIAFGILAGLAHLAGYGRYHWVMSRKSDHDPNAASWFMWGVGGGVELFIYGALVNDCVKEFLPLMCAIGAFLTLLRVGARGASFRLAREDYYAISLDGSLVAYYTITGETVISNVFLGFDILVSFWPILRDTWKKPNGEDPVAWTIWAASYGFLGVAVLLKWENWVELIYPVLYFVLHGAIAAIVRYRVAKN